MHSRRHEDYGSLSPSSKLRNQHRRDADSFYLSGHEVVVDRSPVPRVQQRSLSPNNKNEDLGRVRLRSGRSGSTERRDHSWQKIRSSSPPFVPEHRKPQFYEGLVDRKNEHADDVAYRDGKSSRLRHVHGYHHHSMSSRTLEGKNNSENRGCDHMDEGVIMGQKLMPVEDGIVRRSHRVPLDYTPMPNYEKSGSKYLQLPSRHMDSVSYENEKIRYHEPVSPDNLPADEFYREGEKHMFLSRDDSDGMNPTSHFKGYRNAHFKDFAGSSSSISRREFLNSYREGITASIADEYPRNGMKLKEPMDFNSFGQRSYVDTRDNGTRKRVLTGYPHGAYNTSRNDHDDFVYSETESYDINDIGYPPEDFRRMMPPAPSQLDHEQDLADHEYRELPKMDVMHPNMENVDPTEDSYTNRRYSSTLDHNIHDHMGMGNHEPRRMSYTRKESGNYCSSEDSFLEFGRRFSGDNGRSNAKLSVAKEQHISHLRSNYGFGRDAGPQFHKERLHDPDMSVYDMEMPKYKRHRIEDDLPMHEQLDKVRKRTHEMGEILNSHDSRTVIVSNKNYTLQECKDGCERYEWMDEDTSDLWMSKNERFDQIMYRKAKRTYDGQAHHGKFASEDWSSQQSWRHPQKNFARFHKPGVKYVKSHPRSGPVYRYHPNQSDKQSGIYRKNPTWRRNDEYDEDEAKGVGPLEDRVNVTNPDPPEDSEEFKQLVHEAFLDFSKNLNLSSAVRRRYKEQGRAGSLFCIVCGKSASKDFMDTQRLATHAYMSHKVGLRAQHLGLHKAICVLMGWNTYVPCDTTTFVPDVLSESEAWSQKEDLMLWPPLVIIHNISMSINKPEQQQVIPIEGVQAFLRGKGFVGGKIKVSLGKPTDQSVILVKFLGTFTGLGQAERLNKYFTENKRGREEFERKISSKSRSDLEGEKIEESLLYGYTGVADDLDKLDFNTKKWIIVKSKKDILDLADAPVKTDNK